MLDHQLGKTLDALPGVAVSSLRKQLQKAFFVSPFFLQTIEKMPDLLSDFLHSGDLEKKYDRGTWEQKGSAIKALCQNQSIENTLRNFRKREQLRIIFRDINRIANLEETTSDLSALADLCIGAAHDYYYKELCEELGNPLGSQSGNAQKMAVLALGKLGARELNLSSDVDLIFLYGESGWLDGKESNLSNQEFFVRLSRKIIHCLSNVTSEGFVFRVDMRLRPYGESSALVMNRNAMEQYYLTQGRDWERYAFIKARCNAGDISLGENFLLWLKPFVYKKHLDYGAIESLREMKQMINREVVRKNLQDDLKLGPGGIREIEFIVQANQLICGGKDPELQKTELVKTLCALQDGGYLPEEDRIALESAYCFLRNSEHAIQAENDKQTHRLPGNTVSQKRLAIAMGYDDWTDYLADLDMWRSKVSACFSRIVDSGEKEALDLLETGLQWKMIWRQSADGTVMESLLKGTQFSDVEIFVSIVGGLKSEIDKDDIPETGKDRMDRLMPILLRFTAEQSDATTVLTRVIPVIRSVLRRSTYIIFLLENLDALQRMVFLSGMSSWLAEQLKDFPVLLYELTDQKIHEARFEKSLFARELERVMSHLDPDDLESQMDALRQFKRSWVLKVAVYELLDSLPIMKASDALTWIAEVILQKSIEIAWQYLVERHGSPDGSADTGIQSEVGGFAVLAYGKLGGIELGYQSDLDLVFVHDHDIRAETQGAKPISINTFFMRLGQRIIHILTSHTRFGLLYQIDLRLRPSGNKGPLVATLPAFERYQENDAWTWEHQALVRARFVAGDAKLGNQLSDIRRKVLGKGRDLNKLREEVVGMREKMRRHLSPKYKDHIDTLHEGAAVLVSGFDLKHGLGAIVDIEFLVQYAVLAWTFKFSELGKWTDKMRILDDLERLGLYSSEERTFLQEAYLAYRSAVHYQSLGGTVENYQQLQDMREAVAGIWRKRMLEPLKD